LAYKTIFVECTGSAVHVERENKGEGIFFLLFSGLGKKLSQTQMKVKKNPKPLGLYLIHLR